MAVLFINWEVQEVDPADLIYQKARIFTKWSYVGIISPLTGWALIGASRALLKELKPGSKADIENIMHVEKLNKWSLFASFAWLWFSIIAALISGLVKN